MVSGLNGYHKNEKRHYAPPPLPPSPPSPQNTPPAESADFALVMDSQASGKDTRRAALARAAEKHVTVAKAAQQGQGVDRHLSAMRAASAVEGGDEAMLGAEFFEDPLTAESAGWRLSTSNVSMSFLSSFG